MEMNIDDQPELLSIAMTGSFDELSADWLEVMAARVQRSPTDILFNMAGVNYIDSKGLGALFSLSRHVEDLGHHIYFCELSTPVQEVFELAGLEHLLRIYGTEPEARKAISLMKTGGGAKPSS